jgi:hypothetical protein
MNSDFIEVQTTENQPILIRKDQVGAIESVAPMARTPGHLRVYVAGYKFLLQISKEDFLKKLGN